VDVFISAVMWVGLIATWIQCYRRVGFGEIKREHGIDWREFLIPNLPWFLLTVAKVFFWPVTVVAWFVLGRPAETWRALVEENGREVRAIRRTAQAPSN
jgi:hypothetical protein